MLKNKRRSKVIEDNLIIQQNEKNKEYIEEHRANVWKAYLYISTIFADEIKRLNIKDELPSRCLRHDDSKFSDEEFRPYAINFFPLNEKEKELNASAFNEAWKHHYTTNDHHWNYWAGETNETSREMSDAALFELLCDWEAMSMKFGGDSYSFYHNGEKNKIIMHPNTRAKLEGYITILHNLHQL